MHRIKKKFRYCLLCTMMILFVIQIGGNHTLAVEISTDSGGEVKFRQAVTDENKIKIYIRSAEVCEGASYQVGNIPVTSLETYSIAEDRNPARTLIMLDNSLSVPQDFHGPIKDLLNGLLDAHGEKEIFRLATFSDKINYMSDTYTNDYTALKNMVNSITYSDQETYLTDVLYDVIDDLNRDAYMGYTKLIIISDGVDNKPLGVTREELNSKLKDTPYPIYTVGTFTGGNNDQLENMFALSRITGSEYYVLEESAVNEIVSLFSRDVSITVFEALIPEDAKVGGKQGSKLLLSDGSQIVFDVSLPFIVPGEKKVLPTEEPEPTPMEEKSDGLSLPLIPLIIGGIAIIVTAVIIVIILVKKKGKGKNSSETDYGSTEIQEINTTDTMLIARGTKAGVLPSAGGMEKKPMYKVTLTDKKDITRSFQCELRNSVSVGRAAGNDIVIDSGSVSKRHCMITNKNGRLFIQDLNSTNGTYINGEEIHFDTEIFSGNTIRIGKEELLVKLEQV